MEEILASIRKIISEDQAEPEKSAAQSTAPAQPEAVEVLELTEEVTDDGSVVSVAVEAAMEAVEPQAAPMRELRSFDTDRPRRDMSDVNQDDLISDSARQALGQAFGALDEHQQQRIEETPMPANGNLDAAFERAVRQAFEPALHEWVDSRSNEIMDQLRPLIREWMDANLPALIENAVRNEIARAVRSRGR
jgi:cell pole-organizing protein PopZ